MVKGRTRAISKRELKHLARSSAFKMATGHTRRHDDEQALSGERHDGSMSKPRQEVLIQQLATVQKKGEISFFDLPIQIFPGTLRRAQNATTVQNHIIFTSQRIYASSPPQHKLQNVIGQMTDNLVRAHDIVHTMSKQWVTWSNRRFSGRESHPKLHYNITGGLAAILAVARTRHICLVDTDCVFSSDKTFLT